MLPKKTFLAEILTFGAMQLPINTELYNRFITELSTVYDKGEASAITRIYFEDALHFKKTETDKLTLLLLTYAPAVVALPFPLPKN